MERGKDLAKAANLIRGGKLVAIPTETVYGLAADGTNVDAVAGIFSAKKRPFFDPLILHFYDINDALPYVHSVPDIWYLLTKTFSPGPVTYVLPRSDKVPDLVTSGLDTVGVRFPRHPLTRELLAMLDVPLAAPSANRFGYISPTKPEHIEGQFTNEIDYILDGGVCDLGVESTILDLTTDRVKVLRKGSLSIESLSSIIGYIPEMAAVSSSRPSAPGNIDVHYAPSKPLYVVDFQTLELPENAALLAFGNNADHLLPAKRIQLSEKACTKEAATNFFAALHTLDADDNVDLIYCETFPDLELGPALNDRLTRAGREV
ncbi:MAG: threonylcarbamoyl-AMP synthase [Cryomorphaceae bacterium]|nr:threonylcarbamoyl-AMP synthase [Cryomorphaceae bacterium]